VTGHQSPLEVALHSRKTKTSIAPMRKPTNSQIKVFRRQFRVCGK